MWKPSDFDYHLPPELIAHAPAVPRDSSRLMVVDRKTGELAHQRFSDLPSLLSHQDVLVRNNTKVIPARIFGHKQTGGQVELLLIKRIEIDDEGETWECLTKPGLKLGQVVSFDHPTLQATCVKVNEFTRFIKFNLHHQAFLHALYQIGHTPIPPYIHWADDDEAALRELYQTTFAKIEGSAAAPTAGLHFTPELDQELQAKGVEIIEVTLHVGLGTFLPISEAQLASGKLHSEWYEVSQDSADRLNSARATGKRVIAVGTTTTRTLETVFNRETNLYQAQTGETEIFIYPPYQFRAIDALITNFHLPQSSLLMLISALVSAPTTSTEFTSFSSSLVGRAYATAVMEHYRFFSFGDAMFIQ